MVSEAALVVPAAVLRWIKDFGRIRGQTLLIANNGLQLISNPEIGFLNFKRTHNQIAQI